jgi:hypothetical protein
MTKEIGVVACDVVKNELLRVCEKRGVKVACLEYALHERPKEMPKPINEAVKALLDEGFEKVALGYGLCSNGTVGVSSSNGLIMPRCHDCIAMLLGSPLRYMKMFKEYPGTYFLTDGWIRNAGDPISTVEKRYAPKLGEKRAWKGMSLELANYKTICFVNNGVGDIEQLRKRSQENAKAFSKEYVEVEADLSYFERLVFGPRENADFVILGPGDKVDEDFFHASIELATAEKAVSGEES